MNKVASSAVSPPPLVSIMLVNWNTREMTLECLRSIYAETQQISFEIIVYDNASSDGSVDAIKAEFPAIKLVASESNIGFARATNESAQMAKGRYILLLNTDTIVLRRAIERIVEFAQARPDAKIWGGRTLFRDGTVNPTSVLRKISPWSTTVMALGLAKAFKRSGLFNPESFGGWQRDREREVDIVIGAFLLIERDFWNRLKGFNSDFFMYGEDADLCARACILGARPRMTPDATIIHFGGASTTMFADRIVYVLGSRMGLIDRYVPPLWKPYCRAMTIVWAAWRSYIYRSLAKISPRFKPLAAEWTNAWQRRNEWRAGPLKSAAKG